MISLGDQTDTDRAVAAAKAALPAWAETPPGGAFGLYREDCGHLRAPDRRDGRGHRDGNGRAEGLGPACAGRGRNRQYPRTAIEAARKIEFEHPLEGTPGAHILKEPIGVVGMITPWNWPVSQTTLKVPFAMAAGCTMVSEAVGVRAAGFRSCSPRSSTRPGCPRASSTL